MALNSGLSPNSVQTALDEVFSAQFQKPLAAGEASVEDSLVFQQKTIDRNAWVVEILQGPGYYQERLENADAFQGTVRTGNQKTITVRIWSNDLPISRTFLADEQHDVVAQAVRLLADNAKFTRDREGFSIYNLGFTTETTADATATFSNSHTLLGGATLDNLETGTLTEANLNTMILSLARQTSQDGVARGHRPAVLLVPEALLKSAMEITKSELRSGTGNNDLNYYSTVFPGLQVKWSVFLGASRGKTGSNTAHFLLSDNHSMNRYVREGLMTGLVDWKITTNRQYRYYSEYREVVSAVSPEGIIGSNGTV